MKPTRQSQTPGARFRWALLASAFIPMILVLAMAASARPPGPPPGGPGGAPDERRLEGLVEELGLDAETLEAVDEILDASRDRRRDLGRQLRSAHEKMRSLLEAEEPNQEEIFGQIDALSLLEAQAQKNRVGTLLQVRALLPKEARARLVELMKRRGPEGRRGKHRPPPPHKRW